MSVVSGLASRLLDFSRTWWNLSSEKIREYACIRSINKIEKLRYLGINFNESLVFDSDGIASDMKTNLDELVNNPLLKANQKFFILNLFIWPTLIYHLQNASTITLSRYFLSTTDKMIKGAIKEIAYSTYLQTHRTAFYIQPENWKGSAFLELNGRLYYSI